MHREDIDPRQGGSPADVKAGWSSSMLAKKTIKGKGTSELIVEVAERLYRQIGFQKTTVSDIAFELQMSPANIYRFFVTKSAINEAVCMDLLAKIEVEAEKIAASGEAAPQRIRNFFGTVQTMNRKQYKLDRKLYDLVEASITKKWTIALLHTERMTVILERIIASGMESGQFPHGDATLAARLVNTACIQFHDPRMFEEHEQESEPTLDQMISFCLAGIGSRREKPAP
jgi:AcrR family transcriptional regulator